MTSKRKLCVLTMRVYLLKFYILLTVWKSAHSQGCTPGWFGVGCRYMCHCLNTPTCGISGQCPMNGPCERGYFGPGCQYVDVLQITNSTDSDHFLRDWNDTTCNPQPDATVVTVSNIPFVPFTWFRMVLKDPDNVLKFYTTFGGRNNCTSERKFPVSDRVVDVTCNSRTNIMELQINGPAAGSICSIYVSGGRNVALKQRAEQSSTYRPIIGSNIGIADNAVDGSTNQDFDSGHCTATNSNVTRHWWKLTFSKPQILYKAVIYNRLNGFEFRLSKFSFVAFDISNIQTALYNRLLTNGEPIYEISIGTFKPVKNLLLTITPDFTKSDDNVLTICELQAFGDPVCPEQTYGFDCEKPCRCNVTETCNPFSGACVTACQPGFYGSDCLLQCPLHCLNGICEYISGNCLGCTPGYMGEKCQKECAAGRYGPHCSLSCSVGCLSKCNITDGRCSCNVGFNGSTCEECAAGRYGPHCSLSCSVGCLSECNITDGRCSCNVGFNGSTCEECSPSLYGHLCEKTCSLFCGTEGCDKLTGDCLTCIGMRQGIMCQECPGNYFGPLCESECAINCLNQTCDQLSGVCQGCEEGYHGAQCVKDSSSNPMLYLLYVLPYLLFPCLLILFCLGLKKYAQPEGEGPNSYL